MRIENPTTLLVCAAGFGALALPFSVNAQTTYSIGSGGAWNSPATWSPNDGLSVPTSIDNLVITGLAGNRTVDLQAGSDAPYVAPIYTVASLLFNDTFTATFQGAYNTSNAGTTGGNASFLHITGDLTKQNTGTLAFRNNTTARNITVEVGGNILVEGGVLDFGTVSAANIAGLTVSGSTTVQSGTELRLGVVHSVNLGSVTLATGSALRFGSNSSGVLSMTDFNGGGGVTVLANNHPGRTMTLALSASAGNHLHSGSILRDTTVQPVVLAVTKTGAGRQTLTGLTDFTGAATINEGVLEFSGSSSLTTGNINLAGGVLGLGVGDLNRTIGTGNGQVRLTAANSGFAAYGADRTVTLDGNADLAWATLMSSGSNLVLGDATATHKVTLTNAVNLSSAARTITVGNGAAAVDAALTGIISGTGSSALVKAGDGTLELTGANTYVNGTSITAGTLLVNNTTGSATGSGAVSLAAGATLGGGGTIDGLVTTGGNSSVIHAGAASSDVLTLSGGLDASVGATFAMQLGTASTSVATTAFTGSVAAGDLRFNITNGGGLATGVAYTLLTFDSASGLDYSDLVLDAESISAGYVLDTSFGTGGWQINADSLQVQFSAIGAAIPEPSSISLLAGLAVGTTLLMRRRPRV